MNLNNYNLKLGISLSILILLTACSNTTRPEFVDLPSGADQLTSKLPPPSSQLNATAQAQADAQLVSVPKKCYLESYKGLNKLCIFPKFWVKFTKLVEEFISYKTLFTVLFIFVGIWTIRKFFFS